MSRPADDLDPLLDLRLYKRQDLSQFPWFLFRFLVKSELETHA